MATSRLANPRPGDVEAPLRIALKLADRAEASCAEIDGMLGIPGLSDSIRGFIGHVRHRADLTGRRILKGEAPHRMLLSSEGGDGMRTAETALRRYGLRWRIGECFRALRTGTGIRDRRPDAAGDLRGCLAFDAMTAFRVRTSSFRRGRAPTARRSGT